MLTLIEKIIFVIFVAVMLWLAWRGFHMVWQVISRGSGEAPKPAALVRQAGSALLKWLTTAPAWQMRKLSTLLHWGISLGFVFYLFVNVVDLAEGFFPVHLLAGDDFFSRSYRLLADFFTISVLVGMVYFLIRRFVVQTPRLTYRENVKLIEPVQNGAIRRDSLIVGIFLIVHIGSRFLAESFQLAFARAEGLPDDLYQPFSNALSHLWDGWSVTSLTVGEHLFWWLALGTIIAFLPYFPYTKHFHLVMAGVNFLTKPKRTSLGALEPLSFEDDSVEEFGVAKIEELPWTNLVDAYACIMCNRCQDVCPAYVTGKELSPSALEVNKRYYLNGNLAALAGGAASEFNLLEYAISDSAVWACTTCGACVQACPVGNEPMFDILHIRRRQMLTEGDFPKELKQAYRGMERNGNPWNLSTRDRLKWAGDVPVPTVDDLPDPDLLWWVGCAPSYDPRAQETARAFARILNNAGVRYAVLGERESCTGDSARRSGNEYLFNQLATQNIETLNEVAPKRIVTTCPHCLHTLGKEYKALGGDYQVIHHTQLLSELTAAGSISVRSDSGYDKITFHDPCYLGRHNGIVEEPRTVLRSTMAEVIEMPRHGKQSFCCGAGGAQMWKEEEHGTEKVNVNRYNEAAATGAPTVAVGCPFCLTMLTDAAKSAGEGVQIKDVAEIIADALV
jgi:Fe-S oxidoreductase